MFLRIFVFVALLVAPDNLMARASDAEMSRLIVGSWRDDARWQTTFNADGTYSEFVDTWALPTKMLRRWRIEDGKLIKTFGPVGQAAVNTQTDEIVNLNSRVFRYRILAFTGKSGPKIPLPSQVYVFKRVTAESSTKR